jgi:thiol-disulfide isomerase/thioredoxin
MKKTTILCVMALLCLKKPKAGTCQPWLRPKLKACLLITLLSSLFIGQSTAQDHKQNLNTTKNNSLSFGESLSRIDFGSWGGALKIGERLPETFWQQEHNILKNGKTATVKFQALKGKALLLDFWATWCSACLKGFPKMQALQNRYSKNLNILMVNTYEKDTLPVLSQFYQKQQQAIKGFSLSLVASDAALKNMFPVKSIPHYIWLGADGRIKAITDAEAVTDAQVKRFIAGLSLNLKLKER